MKLHKCIRHAISMVVHSRLRSWLTIIGIVIGVASVIAIVAVGDGMEAAMNERMGDLGADVLTLSAGYSRSSGFGPQRGGDDSSLSDPITRRDVQVLKGVSEIEYIDTQISGRADVYYIGEEGSMSVTGVDQKVWADMTTDDVDQGRLLDSADQNVVVIGYSLAHNFFENEIGLNKIITIEGMAFRVVGILEEGTRNNIYMPIQNAYQILDSVQDEYDSVVIQVREGTLDEAEAEIEKKLMNSRHVNEKTRDFTLSSSAQMNEMRTEVMSTMTTFLTVIAAISLLVGAVGIANTMFTSVLEKTKEIGIMKAIGAKNSDILYIFLFHAGAIGLTGGIIGVGLGWVLSKVLTMAGMTTLVSANVVFIALGVSIGVGMIAGLIPAMQASELNPVDALRYE